MDTTFLIKMFCFIFILFVIYKLINIFKIHKVLNREKEFVYYIENSFSTKNIRLENNSKFKNNFSITGKGLKDIKNYLSSNYSTNLSINTVKNLIEKKRIKIIFLNKTSKLIDIVKKDVKALITKSLVTNVLEIPSKEFEEEYLNDFQIYLLEKENINIDMDYLKKLIEDIKLSIYKKRIFEIIDQNALNDLDLFAKAYFEIYGYNINRKYIIWLKKISKKEFDLKNIVNKIEEERERRRKYIQINNISNLINSSEPSIKTYNIEDIDLMTGKEFEVFLEELFNKLGYNTKLTKLSGDQGGDLIIEREIKTVVQAKRYSKRVTNTAVQEVIGAKKYYEASRAMVITNNYFTKSAKKLARVNDVELWNRDVLIEKLKLL